MIRAAKRGRRLNRSLAALAFLLAILAALAGGPVREGSSSAKIPGSDIAYIEAELLAEWIMSKDIPFQLLDLRGAEDFARYSIPFALNVRSDTLADRDLAGAARVVVYLGDDDLPPGVVEALDRHREAEVLWLRGGMDRWAERILFPDLSSESMTPEDRRRIAKRSRFFGGEPTMPPDDEGRTPGIYLREGC